jgi:TPR repeat protein
MDITVPKDKAKRLKKQAIKTGERKSLEETKKRLRRQEISYVSEGYFRTHSRTVTTLDFTNHTWKVYSSVESPRKPEKNKTKSSKGTIPPAAEDEFAARLYFIRNLGKKEYSYDKTAYDAPVAKAYILGKKFFWMPVTTFGMACFRNFGRYGVGYRNGDEEQCREVLEDSLYSELFDQISYAFSRLMHVCEHPEEEPLEEAFVPVEDFRQKAVEQYQKKAEQGDIGAICHLGDLYYYGVYVGQDRKHALELYKKAAVKGALPAMNMLADLYYYGDGGLDQDYHQAIRLYRELSRKKHNRYVQYQLGRMYLAGQGVKKNEKRAVKYFWLSGYYDYEPSTWEYIKCLYYGVGVKQDRNKAMDRKYRISFQHQRELVRMLENDFDSLGWGEKYELAMLYQNFIHHKSWERKKYTEEEKRLEKAAHQIIYKAAENGYAKAEFEIAHLYQLGPEFGYPDIPEDEGKAIEWYTRSAEHGYFDAKWELVWYYMRGGFFVLEATDKKDLAKARYWFKQLTPKEQKERAEIGKEIGIGEE